MSILIIGCGKMGGIILQTAIKSDLFSRIGVVEPSESGRQAIPQDARVTVYATVPTTTPYDIAVVCVKPWMVKQVLTELRPEMVHLVASIAAGISMADLHSYNPSLPMMMRVMPNTPCQVNHGMTAVVCEREHVTQPEARLVVQLFERMGRVVEWPDESHLDAFTALCGSGPGLMLTVLEAFADGALLHGIPKPMAIQFAAQTMLGTAHMVLANDTVGCSDHPSVLRDQVCTPAGCTIGGIVSLHQHGVPGAIMTALSDTVKRLQ